MKKQDNEDIVEKDEELTEESGSEAEASDTGDSAEEDQTEDGNDTPDDEAEEEKADKKEDPKKDKSASEKLPANRKAIIFEIALAVVAVIVIIVAIALRQKQKSENPDTTGVSVSTGEEGADLAEIDNSILFATTPAIPEMVQNESLDYEALVAENKMIKLKGSEGQDIYVHNYHNSEYFNEETKYDESELEKLLVKNVLINYLEPETVSRNTAQMYDTVSINFVGTMDGVAFDGGTADNQELTIGVSAYIDGFTEGIVGMKVGETKDVHVTFPEDYSSADLAGKPAVFAITLNAIISGNKIPELTDEMANTYTGGEMTTAKELKDYFKKNLLSLSIWDFIDTDFYLSSVSDEAVMDYYNKIINQIDTSSKQYQMSAEALISMYYGVDVEAYKSEMMAEALESMRHSLLYNAIADNEGITVSDDEVAKLASSYGFENVEEFKSTYGEDIIHDYLLQDSLMTYFLSLHN